MNRENQTTGKRRQRRRVRRRRMLAESGIVVWLATLYPLAVCQWLGPYSRGIAAAIGFAATVGLAVNLIRDPVPLGAKERRSKAERLARGRRFGVGYLIVTLVLSGMLMVRWMGG